MRALHVAEKNSVAKGIAGTLSGGRYSTRVGASKYNPIYEFQASFLGKV